MLDLDPRDYDSRDEERHANTPSRGGRGSSGDHDRDHDWRQPDTRTRDGDDGDVRSLGRGPGNDRQGSDAKGRDRDHDPRWTDRDRDTRERDPERASVVGVDVGRHLCQIAGRRAVRKRTWCDGRFLRTNDARPGANVRANGLYQWLPPHTLMSCTRPPSFVARLSGSSCPRRWRERTARTAGKA
jgi:hypothetical protein